jgi:glucose dehydrogenase
LFAGEGAGGSNKLRAHDKQTGEIVAEFELPSTQTGQPFTYEHNGKQYVTVLSGLGGLYGQAHRTRVPNVPLGGSVWTFALGD